MKQKIEGIRATKKGDSIQVDAKNLFKAFYSGHDLETYINWYLAKYKNNLAAINTVNKAGFTALHMAKESEQMKQLIAAGIPINTTGSDDTTPLMAAAARGQLKAVRDLLALGADLTLKDSKGKTAEMLARENKKDFIVPFLDPKYLSSLQRLNRINCTQCEPDMICPFSKTIMTDPVTVSTGITYDRMALQYEFSQGEVINRFYPTEAIKCPLTNLLIYKDDLSNGTNLIIKNKIDKFISRKEAEYAGYVEKVSATTQETTNLPPVLTDLVMSYANNSTGFWFQQDTNDITASAAVSHIGQPSK